MSIRKEEINDVPEDPPSLENIKKHVVAYLSERNDFQATWGDIQRVLRHKLNSMRGVLPSLRVANYLTWKENRVDAEELFTLRDAPPRMNTLTKDNTNQATESNTEPTLVEAQQPEPASPETVKKHVVDFLSKQNMFRARWGGDLHRVLRQKLNTLKGVLPSLRVADYLIHEGNTESGEFFTLRNAPPPQGSNTSTESSTLGTAGSVPISTKQPTKPVEVPSESTQKERKFVKVNPPPTNQPQPSVEKMETIVQCTQPSCK